MPFGGVKLIPGVNVERTPTLNEAGYSSSQLIRWRDGLAQPLAKLAPLPAPTAPLQPLHSGPRPGQILAGRNWQKRRLFAQAAAAKGQITTVILLSPTARPHRHSFQPEGFWLQTGGLFGPADRQGPRLCLISFRRRIAEETARIAPFRPIA